MQSTPQLLLVAMDVLMIEVACAGALLHDAQQDAAGVPALTCCDDGSRRVFVLILQRTWRYRIDECSALQEGLCLREVTPATQQHMESGTAVRVKHVSVPSGDTTGRPC